MNEMRRQIRAMQPERFARAAKRAALLAKELADRAGIPIPKRVQYLVDTSEDEIASRRRLQLSTEGSTTARRDPSGADQ